MSFDGAIANLASWAGNTMLPTLAGLFFAGAVYRYSKNGPFERLLYGGFASLSCSGILRALEGFVQNAGPTNADAYWTAVLNLVNWTANVILPIFALTQLAAMALHNRVEEALTAFTQMNGARAQLETLAKRRIFLGTLPGMGETDKREHDLLTPNAADLVPVEMPWNNIGSLLASIPTLAAAFPLPWSAYLRLMTVKNPDARAFYETKALRSGWSIHQLNRQIGSQFYERIALSRNKAAMLEKAEIAESGP